MNEREKPLNVKQAAAFLGLKPSCIYNLVCHRKLAAYKPGGKILFFKQSDLEAYVFRNRQAADFELAEPSNAILNGEAK
jgi:excisionase family DNA binding protein